MSTPSPQMQEEVVAIATVLQSWGYATRIVAPVTRAFRRQLAGTALPVTDFEGTEEPTPIARWRAARDLAAILRRHKPMLLHTHGFHSTIASLLARRGLSEHVPVVISPRMLPHLLHSAPVLGLRRLAYARALVLSDAIVLPTETQREELLEVHSAAEEAEIVPYCIPRRTQPPSLDLGRRRKLLGMTASATLIGCVVDDLKRRALERFLDAAANLCMEYPSLEFALIGREVDDSQHHEMVHEHGLLGATVFVDPHDRFHRAISSLNVLVTPQSGWPSGMLALQALAANVGVIALEGGEVDEAVGLSPQVTIVPADGTFSLGEGIIRQLGAASQRMRPVQEETHESATISSFLVSREFFDLDESWGRPEHGGEGHREQPSGPDLAASFDPTLSTRALVAVYQRLLDQAEEA